MQVSTEFCWQPLIAGRDEFGEADHRYFVSWPTRPQADAVPPNGSTRNRSNHNIYPRPGRPIRVAIAGRAPSPVAIASNTVQYNSFEPYLIAGRTGREGSTI